jgi:hypothetical protein
MYCPSCGSTEVQKLPEVNFVDGPKFQVQCKKCNFLIKDFDGINWTIQFAQMIARNLGELYRAQESNYHLSGIKSSFKFEYVQVGKKKVERQSIGVYHRIDDKKYLPLIPSPPRYAQYKDYWIDLETLKAFLEKEFLEGL